MTGTLIGDDQGECTSVKNGSANQVGSRRLLPPKPQREMAPVSLANQAIEPKSVWSVPTTDPRLKTRIDSADQANQYQNRS
jgi:hypothetical protein